MLKVDTWMTPDPFHIQSKHTLREAGRMMDKLQVDCIPVIDELDCPVGIVTMRNILYEFLYGNPQEVKLTSISKDSCFPIRSSASLLDILALPYEHFPVVDDQGKLIGMLTRKDILEGLSNYIQLFNQTENTAEILSIILESAYEGIAVVDENGILVEFNEAYSRFTGVSREDAMGSHVTEVIENTNLHNTVKTAIPDRGTLQNIQGQDMVVHRIPIWKDGKVIGAIGMLIFEGVTEVYHVYERLQMQKKVGQERTKQQPVSIKSQKEKEMTMDQIIGVSERTSNLKRIARKAAKTAAPTLITGESGTGKEMYAKSIHQLNTIFTGPFINVNCDLIPEHEFESVLFGYGEEAFSYNKRDRKPGKFEMAQNGTLFLAEIDKMPLKIQKRLLRVLQEKELEHLEGTRKYHINVRVIAATRQDLKEIVASNKFLEDLYNRLNIINLHIPPLRERMEDIPILLSYYMKEICYQYQIPEKSFTSSAVSVLMHYQWHDNVGEIVNVIEKLVTLVDGKVIDVDHLPDNIKGMQLEKKESQIEYSNQATLIEQIKNKRDEREKQMILSILEKADGNKSKAAELLGIHRTTLYKKIRKYKIKA